MFPNFRVAEYGLFYFKVLFINIKSKQKQNSTIIIDDIKRIINPESKVTTEDSGISSVDIDIDNSVLEKHPHHKIILDASINVNSGEGVEGYTALFRSRYEKSLRILSLRPESKRITKITSIKQKTGSNSKNIKSDKLYDVRGNPISNSTSVVSGLLMSKRGKKNGVEI